MSSSAFIADRIVAQDGRQFKVYERPACTAAGHAGLHPRSTDVNVTCVIRGKKKKKEIRVLINKGACAIDRNCTHGRMANPYRRKIDSLRNTLIINYWRTRACKWNRHTICTLSTHFNIYITHYRSV